ncbi:hypothetical protein [Sporomusa acidovorans]|uniref:Chromosome partition protein Smc n=1 Tax=Sporomusa acidovorans (strain ATCC 49682 / DSM 3132 / Mol) TaxID=1123286 RepID=A0ABZ3IWX4_SPOA4|nr:hypothetical protein [Sporomusa acidovorans]OZC23657.1 hypothetical protein SPACI_05590 [Sporomusa acidovorans DSM 3132]SDE24107.1 hypothetical protein SAMN04488499_101085 [Sporomusa acidovorans]
MAGKAIVVKITADNQGFVKAIFHTVEMAKAAERALVQAGSSAGTGFSNASASTAAFGQTLANVTIIANGVVNVVGKIRDILAKAIAPGIDYTKQMESARVGVAGILLSMTELNGRQLELNEALSISEQTFESLQQRSLQFNLNIKDTAGAFQAIVGPGLAAQMTLEEIVQIATTGTKAVKSFGLDSMQVIQELRAMVSGDINMDSQVSKALGITATEVAQAKQTAGGLFQYLNDKLKGFLLVAGEIPKTLAGKTDMLNAALSLVSEQGFKPLIDTAKAGLDAIIGYLTITTVKTDEFGKTIKKVEMNPEVVSALKESSEYLSGLIKSGVNFSVTLAKIASGPAPLLLSVIKLILDNAGQVTFTLLAWMSISKLRPILADILLQLQYQLSIFRMLVATSGTFKATLITTGTVIKSLLATTGWGLLAVAIGYAADQAFKLYENLSKAGKAKTDYFKEKENINSPLPQQLEGKLEKPVYNVNPDVNMGLKQGTMDKLEKFIAAINYMFPDNAVTVTSGFRPGDTGGHGRGEKADIYVAGTEDPFFRQQIMSLAKEFGIAVLDEMTAPADPSKADMWGPHLDLNFSEENDLNLTDPPQTAKELKEAELKFLEAQREGIEKEYIAQLSQQETKLKQQFQSAEIGDNEYFEQIGTILTQKVVAQIETIRGEIADKTEAMSNKNYTAADKKNIEAEIEALLSEIRVKEIELAEAQSTNSYEYRQAALESKDQALDAQILLLKLEGNLEQAARMELQKSENVKRLAKLAANKADLALKAQQASNAASIIEAQVTDATTNIGYVVNDMGLAQGKLIQSVLDGTTAAGDSIKQFQADFDTKIKTYVDKLNAALAAAKEIGWMAKAREIEQKLREVKGTVLDYITDLLDALDKALQQQIDAINANLDLTPLQKTDLIEAAQRATAAKKAVVYGMQADAILAQGNKGAEIMANIAANQANLSTETSKYVTILEQVRKASKDAFEDGLLTFLTDGITKCATLGEAFRNLAVTVLSAIQRIYAQALTKNIMAALGLTSPVRPTVNGIAVQGPFKADGSFATGGSFVDSFGVVHGPGTSTSDSILAYAQKFGKIINIGNGEGILTGRAVQNLGERALAALNDGVDPRKIFKNYATGGLLTDRNVAAIPGPQELAASLVNNNSTTIPLSIANFIDPGTMSKFVKSREGKRALLNYIKEDAGTIKRILRI